MGDFFQNFNQHCRDKCIFLKKFWDTNRICLSLDQFKQLCEKNGYYLRQSDMKCLNEYYPQQLITLKSLHDKVSLWKSDPLNLSEFIQEKATEIERQQLMVARMSNSIPKHRHKPCASLHEETTEIDTRDKQLFQERRRLKEYRDRQRRAQLQLHKNILKNQNEGEFELVLKVAEANELSAKLKNGKSFTLSKEQNKNPVVTMMNERATDDKDKKKELNSKEFLRQYILLKEESNFKVTYDKETSEVDLKKVLVETMYLSEQLQSQMQLLKSRGITH